MKKISFILIYILICQFTCAQVSRYTPANSPATDRSFIISGSPTLLYKTPNGTQFAGGIKVQYFLGKRFSLDADLVFSRDYAHLSPGLIGVPLAFFVLGQGDNTFGEFLGSVAVLALSFEHVSYHIPASDDFDISPYVSLLRYKYAYKFSNYSDPTFTGEQFSFASGLQLNKYIGRFVFSPYAEYYIGYKDHKSGCNIGVYFGIYWKSQSH